MRVPLSELEARLAGFQAELISRELDAALIVQSVDLYYLTGTAQQSHLLLPARGEPLLLVRRDVDRAQAESPLAMVESLDSLRDLPAAASRLGLPEGARLGLELDVLPAANFRRYQELFPQAAITDCSPLLRKVRSVKSPWELERLREAGEQAEAGFAAGAAALRPGITEAELTSHILAELIRKGHPALLRMRGLNQEMSPVHAFAGPEAGVPSYSDTPFGGSGRTPAVPQGASDRPIQRGEAVVVDVGGSIDGYMVDQTRTFFLGTPPEELARAYEACLSIKKELVEAARPGERTGDLYELAAGRAAELGYKDYFMGAAPKQVSFVGHGLGLEVNELPVLGRGSNGLLLEGNVIAIEPKIRFPGRGAVGVEDTCVVTPTGLEQLTRGDDRLREI